MRLLKNTNIQFIKNRYVFFAISAILVLASFVGIIFNGLNWSIDFSSGVAAKVNLKSIDAQVPKIDELRSVLKANGMSEAEIQRVGAPEDGNFMIKLKSRDATKDTSSATKDLLIKTIQTALPDYIKGRDMNKDVIQEIYVVGPKVGGELRTQALLAVVIALLLMIVYIWFRFEFTFGLMAIIALFHDVMIILGIFAFTGREITVQIIAVLLTIVGYSINDTIVVFDRIREDLKSNRKDDYKQIFNHAINSTLSRTIITSVTTFITAFSLFLFGGSVIHDFAFAMCLGLVFGTYSSVFVASNLVVEFYRFSHKEKDSIKHLTKRK